MFFDKKIIKEIIVNKIREEHLDLLLKTSTKVISYFNNNKSTYVDIEVGNILSQTFFDLLDLMRVQDKKLEKKFYTYLGHDINKIEEEICFLIQKNRSSQIN